MRPLDTLAAAAGGLAGNRLRSALTMLGIVIGVAAVITLVAVGRGASAQVTARLAGLGTNLVLVMPWRGTVLSTEDARELGERIPGVRTAMPVRTLSVTARHGTRTYETTATGVTQDYPSVRGHPVAAGRFLTAADVAGRRPVAVLGRTVADALFPSGTSGTLGAGPLGGGPLGETILLNGRPFRVVGVLQPKGATLGQNADDAVLIPVTVAQRLAGDTALSRIDLEAASPAEAPLVVDQALRILRLRHPRADGQDPVRVTSQDELLETVESSSRTFSLMLGAIAAISLVVGGIGIMNILLVSVRERTREIGVRMAVGARRRDILAQFLLEAVLLSLAGGLVGVAAGVGGATALARLGNWPAAVPADAVLVALGFAVAVGLFFGVYPAVQASRLDPVQALRSE